MIQNLHEEYKLAKNIYSAENVLLSATHTHSGPAGYMQYALFQATSLGFINQTFNALVDGITKVSGFIMFYSYIMLKLALFYIMVKLALFYIMLKLALVNFYGTSKHKTCQTFICRRKFGWCWYQ